MKSGAVVRIGYPGCWIDLAIRVTVGEISYQTDKTDKYTVSNMLMTMTSKQQINIKLHNYQSVNNFPTKHSSYNTSPNG